MARTLIRQIIDTMQNPFGMFRSLGEVEVAKDIYGEPIFVAGADGAVFKVVCGGEYRALKCYTSPIEGLGEVYAYISSLHSEIVCPVRFLPDEVYIYSLEGGYSVDALVMPWYAGRTLEYALRRAAHTLDGKAFARMADGFDRLTAELIAQEWAHGDLKPDNIIVSDEGTMSLVDFDALYSPLLPPRGAMGTPGYTHPKRGANHYGKFIDDYSIALLSVSLHALAREPKLYSRFNTQDSLILQPELILEGKDNCFDIVSAMFADDERLSRLCTVLTSPDPTNGNHKTILK